MVRSGQQQLSLTLFQSTYTRLSQPQTLVSTSLPRYCTSNIYDSSLTPNSPCTSQPQKQSDAAHGDSITQVVSYSLRCDKKSSPFNPTQNLRLFKFTVLPHFLQNLRWFQSSSEVKKLMTSLNLSLLRALHVYAEDTALLADTDILPLTLIQYTHLAQIQFRPPPKHDLPLFLPFYSRPSTSHWPSANSTPVLLTTTPEFTPPPLHRTPCRPSPSHGHLAP